MAIQHFGNVDISQLTSADYTAKAPTLSSLEKTFDTSGYLAPYSDTTRLGWETRVALHEKRLNTSSNAFRERVADVVDYMLFVDEAPIASTCKAGQVSQPLSANAAHAISKGRLLRQLDLTTRLLRYPCSYMIYSAQFERLPAEAKNSRLRPSVGDPLAARRRTSAINDSRAAIDRPFSRSCAKRNPISPRAAQPIGFDHPSCSMRA